MRRIKRRGFTLAELMVYITLVTIISIVISTAYKTTLVQQKGTKELQKDSKNVSLATKNILNMLESNDYIIKSTDITTQAITVTNSTSYIKYISGTLTIFDHKRGRTANVPVTDIEFKLLTNPKGNKILKIRVRCNSDEIITMQEIKLGK